MKKYFLYTILLFSTLLSAGPKTKEEKAMQRALIQYKHPKNYNLVYKALTLANRTDLIGFSKNHLIKPKRDRK